MTSRALSHVRPVPRRGLSRDEAAMYIGISTSKFDQLIADGRMPGAKRIDGRKVWDVRELDLHFDELPQDDSGAATGNSWDDR
jgi:excisionase family DNA binding protein